MKLEFNEEDVKQAILEKAKAMGFNGNTISTKASYGQIESVTVSFEEPIEAAPPITPPHSMKFDEPFA